MNSSKKLLPWQTPESANYKVKNTFTVGQTRTKDNQSGTIRLNNEQTISSCRDVDTSIINIALTVKEYYTSKQQKLKSNLVHVMYRATFQQHNKQYYINKPRRTEQQKELQLQQELKMLQLRQCKTNTHVATENLKSKYGRYLYYIYV